MATSSGYTLECSTHLPTSPPLSLPVSYSSQQTNLDPSHALINVQPKYWTHCQTAGLSTSGFHRNLMGMISNAECWMHKNWTVKNVQVACRLNIIICTSMTGSGNMTTTWVRRLTYLHTRNIFPFESNIEKTSQKGLEYIYYIFQTWKNKNCPCCFLHCTLHSLLQDSG